MFGIRPKIKNESINRIIMIIILIIKIYREHVYKENVHKQKDIRVLSSSLLLVPTGLMSPFFIFFLQKHGFADIKFKILRITNKILYRTFK